MHLVAPAGFLVLWGHYREFDRCIEPWSQFGRLLCRCGISIIEAFGDGHAESDSSRCIDQRVRGFATEIQKSSSGLDHAFLSVGAVRFAGCRSDGHAIRGLLASPDRW